MAITRTKEETLVSVKAVTNPGAHVRVAVRTEGGEVELTVNEAKRLRKELKQAIRAVESRGF